MIVLLSGGLGLLIGVMSLAWLVQRLTGNSGWVDVAWSFGTGLCGVFFALAPIGGAPIGGAPLGGAPVGGAPVGGALVTDRQIAVAVLVALWSVRLGWHIAVRSATGHDDPRYAELRREWGANAQWKLFRFLMIQALVAWGLAVSMLLAARNPVDGFRLPDLLGAAVLIIAIAGEGVADWQLRRFKADPANSGLVCDAGLWSWSRHPNYFFEFLGWVAYPLLAIGAWGWGWFALTGPALMFWTLRYASGVPPLEAHMLRRYGDLFRDYQSRVNAFFPAPPATRRLQIEE